MLRGFKSYRCLNFALSYRVKYITKIKISKIKRNLLAVKIKCFGNLNIYKPNCLRELSLLCKPTKTIRFCVYYWFWYKSSYISFPRLITRCSFWRFYLWFYSTSGNIIKIGNLWIIKIWFNYITLWYSVFKPTYFFMDTCRMLYVFL